jgi:glycerophosphoryl diester phosphodiesterase
MRSSSAGCPIEIVCHRGGNEHAPENTYAAAQLCIDWGVDYVEVDLWTSRDGVMYLMHDGMVDRTTDGSGHLMALTSGEIDRLDAGSWFDPQFAGERVPRFDEFLPWIKGKAGLFIDVKFAHPQQLIDLLEATGMKDDCFFWSGSKEWMALAHILDPTLALKINVSTVGDVHEAYERYGARIIEVDPAKLTTPLQACCRQLGIKVMAYQSKKDVAAYRRILEAGADMINLNHADVFLQELAAYQRQVS